MKSKVQIIIVNRGPEERYRYSHVLSLASELDGVRGQRHAPAALSPGQRHFFPCTAACVGLRAFLHLCEKTRLLPGFDPRTV